MSSLCWLLRRKDEREKGQNCKVVRNCHYHWCYYLHMLRYSVSPVCGIFFVYKGKS